MNEQNPIDQVFNGTPRPVDDETLQRMEAMEAQGAASIAANEVDPEQQGTPSQSPQAPSTDGAQQKQEQPQQNKADPQAEFYHGDAPRDKEGWRIEIGGNKHPDLPTLVLDNCSVATSGDTEQYVEINNIRYSHIIDPQSGYGLRNLSQVTIIAPTGLIADSIATAALVLGPDKTKETLIENNQTLAYFVTRKEKQTNLIIIKK